LNTFRVDLVARLGGRVPTGDRPHLLGRAAAEGLRPQDVLEEDAKREGKAFEVVLGGERVQADELERAISRRQRCKGSEAVSHGPPPAERYDLGNGHPAPTVTSRTLSSARTVSGLSGSSLASQTRSGFDEGMKNHDWPSFSGGERRSRSRA